MRKIREDVFLNSAEFYNRKLSYLAAKAKPEKWFIGSDPTKDPFRILRNYFEFTYERISQESKFVHSKCGNYFCMNTGLLTVYDEDIVSVFKKNPVCGKQPWLLDGFFKHSEKNVTFKFPRSPELADYTQNPSELIFHRNYKIAPDYEHIIDDNFQRFERIGYTDKTLIKAFLAHAVEVLNKRLVRNFKLAIPHYYHNTETGESKIQLLAPLYFPNSPVKLALVIDKVSNNAGESYYDAKTVLPVSWAYMNARLIVKPDEEWADIINLVESDDDYE